MKRQASTNQQGFTLLELIIVVAMIGILATIALPSLRDYPMRTKEAVLRTNLHTLRFVLDRYHGDTGHYPSSLQALVDGGYLRRVPVDPLAGTGGAWVLLFENEELHEVEAVNMDLSDSAGIMDVRSSSALTSLDGTLYSDW
ncbi:MAG: prepilin-type N-terminal cleavage/methylation domain-containing protein [Acidobacteriota bacterium]